MSERGSIAPLIAGYLAMILLTLLGSAAVGVSMIAANRVQAVADAAVLYGHDRSITRGIPDGASLQTQVTRFLASAPSAQRLEVVGTNAFVSGPISNLELCARVENPLWVSHKIVVCRSARAESYIIR